MQDKKLVLSGSGSLFPFHLGAMQRLSGSYNFTELIATSGGSIVAGLYCSGRSLDEIEDIIVTTMFGNMLDLDLTPLSGYGVYKGDKLLEFLSNLIPQTFRQLEIPLTVITTRVNSNYPNYEFIFSKETTPDTPVAVAIRSSISIPVVFNYYNFHGNMLVDGGLVNNYASNYIKDGQGIGIKILSTNQKNRGELKPSEIGLVDYLYFLTELSVSNSERLHMENGTDKDTVFLETELSGFDFDVPNKVKISMIRSGFEQADKWLSK